MNASKFRAELIEPLLEQAGWGRNFPLTDREVKIFREAPKWWKSKTSFCGFCFEL